MGYAILGSWRGAVPQDELMDGLRQTRVYREATPRERLDLEKFVEELRREPPTALDLSGRAHSV